MSEIDLNDYVSGGYIVTTYFDDPYQKPYPSAWKKVYSANVKRHWEARAALHRQLLPPRLVSAGYYGTSLLFQPPAGILWGNILNPKDPFLKFLSNLLATAYINNEVGWGNPCIFYSLKTAKEFLRRFVLPTTATVVIGIGLHNSLTNSFIAEINSQAFFPGETPLSKRFGAGIAILDEKYLEVGGIILGYELLRFWSHAPAYHSMFGVESDNPLAPSNIQRYFQDFQIHPNESGFYSTFEDAKKLADGDEFPYYPFLIVKYPLP